MHVFVNGPDALRRISSGSIYSPRELVLLLVLKPGNSGRTIKVVKQSKTSIRAYPYCELSRLFYAGIGCCLFWCFSSGAVRNFVNE
jgi:hypothetical protein